MPETETPETIRSALAYFQRGGLVEMTERTLAEMAAGRKVVECDADGVLALCSLAAEAMVARAGRDETPEDAALVEAMASSLTPAMADVLAAIGDGPDADGYEPCRIDFDGRTVAALDRRGLVAAGFDLKLTELGRQVLAVLRALSSIPPQEAPK